MSRKDPNDRPETDCGGMQNWRLLSPGPNRKEVFAQGAQSETRETGRKTRLQPNDSPERRWSRRGGLAANVLRIGANDLSRCPPHDTAAARIGSCLSEPKGSDRRISFPPGLAWLR